MTMSMEQYIPLGLITLIVGSLIAVKVQLEKRPTYKDTEKRYKKIEVCDEVHKSVNEKLSCVPEIKDTVTEIKTKIDILVDQKSTNKKE